MSPNSQPLFQPCQTCSTTRDKTFTCIQCNNLAFCDACWPKWILHVPGSVGWNGKAHEKADPLVLRRLRQILEPSRSEAEHAAELLEDEDTTWFGFGRDASGHSVFHDYGRFAAIMSETLNEELPERHPQIASFIGETGAGKSTLIKLLIDRQDLTSPDGSKYYAPVTSSNHDRIATTGDVHLYGDPSTLYSGSPLLLVDCEGLSGGEAMPKQLKNRSLDSSSDGYHRTSTPRPIAWAKTPQTKKREFAVAQLYPRILYTFSDVVVFVLRNPRAFESTVLDKLIRWGAASIDKSLNQPVLPHCIIVFNATEPNIDEMEWDVTTATQMLMSDIGGAIAREPALQEYVQIWRKRGRHINSTKDLLECYYASISVIRIPYKGSYMLMNEQAEKLANLIKDRCRVSHLRKKKVRMLSTPDKLQFYLQAAYDHFTKDLDSPFDFVKEALRHSPVSRNFEGNILNLALAIKDRSGNSLIRSNAEQIFRAMGPIIASCVMFDTVRQNLLGTATRLLDDRYARPCANALQTFADMHWPCSFTNPAYPGEQGRCVNVRSGHNPKGHQNSMGKIIGNGDYESDFYAAEFGPAWIQVVKSSLIQLQSSAFRLSQEFPDMSELDVAALLHRERLNEQFTNVLGGATDFVSYTACLCCLRELPECALPCGHVLCLSCIEVYGVKTSRTTIEITRCPLHVRDIIASPPWVVITKPLHAGARVLCLDGGGVRGIVQLQVLKEVENILGPELPIQLFFDLIVGTNTGGIIALGLGVKKWTVSTSIEKFKELCKEAFTPREMRSVPVFGALSSIYHGSIYKTSPFSKALEKYFSDQPLFGGRTHRSRYDVSLKVAVTATTSLEKQSVVFANYNRPDPVGKKLPYQFTRSNMPSKEVRVWEAARATSATAPFFKPYMKPETSHEYVDDGSKQTCPVSVAYHESMSIWSDIADSPPDLMLSIGTGRNVGDGNGLSNGRSSNSISNNSASKAAANAVIRQGRGGVGNYKHRDKSKSLSSTTSTQRNTSTGYFVRDPNAPLLLSFNNPNTGADILNDHRKGDKIWNKFLAGDEVKPEHRNRYLRVNPELFSALPKFADVSKIDNLERETAEVLRQNPATVLEVAHRLVASTFFFERDPSSVKQTPFGFTCTGSIYCRFRQSSTELRSLGWFMVSHLEGDFEPFFQLEQEGPGSSPRKIVLTQPTLQDMHLHGHFYLDPIRIDTLSEHSEVVISLGLQAGPSASDISIKQISGFPRRVMAEGGHGIVQAAAPSIARSTIEKPPSLINLSTKSPGSTASTLASPATSFSSGHSPVLTKLGLDLMIELPDSPPAVELHGHSASSR